MTPTLRRTPVRVPWATTVRPSEQNVLARPRSDRQYLLHCAWKEIGSLAHVISPEDRPLIETVALAEPEYEIVDGWGRLLPFAALLHEGLAFHPFETFLASRDLARTVADGGKNAPAKRAGSQPK